MSQFGACLAGLGGLVVAAYVAGAVGIGLSPLVLLMGALILTLGCALAGEGGPFGRPAMTGGAGGVPVALPLAMTICLTLVAALTPAWPDLLPPGGASDLTHHLALVDVIARTGRLVTDPAAEAVLGEMAHYTPGIHLLIVLVAAAAGLEPLSVVHPLLALTVALKAGTVFAIAWLLLDGMRGRTALALAATALTLFAPRAYSVDGFLRAGFVAQVAAELFVVAGWLGLAWWARHRQSVTMAFVGLMAASAFVVWPIWIGPLMFAVAVTTIALRDLHWRDRAVALGLAGGPLAVVAALHLWRHAAWLRMAGASGAVPALPLDAAGVVLTGLALAGALLAITRRSARVTLAFAVGLALQAVALLLLARARGAATPYMAMKMTYLAVYPAAVLATLALARVVAAAPRSTGDAVAWTLCAASILVGGRHLAGPPVPPSITARDLQDVGRWARATIDPECVDYVVRDAERAYWLHLAVMGGSRASARTADLDTYTANDAVGRWLDGRSRRYGVAELDLLPAEVRSATSVRHRVGGAVVIARPLREGDPPCAAPRLQSRQ